MTDIPQYKDLPRLDELSARHSWGVFGKDDDLGRINLITDVTVAAAASEIRTGARFNLSLPLDRPMPSWSKSRKPYQHTIFSINRNSQDDYLDSFYMQRSTQWDGLRHVRAGEFGFYHGVLVDMVAHGQAVGRPLAPDQCFAITVPMLQAALQRQNVSLRSGDILLLRTGYAEAVMTVAPEKWAAMAADHQVPGLHAGEEMAEFLWNSGVAAICADNPAVEVAPGDPAAGSFHRRMIPLLGFALGEFFLYDKLAADCARDGRYTCFFTGAPLNVPGAVGSPGNALAIK